MPLSNIHDISSTTRSHLSSLPLATQLISGACILIELLRLIFGSTWIESLCFAPNAGLSLIYRTNAATFLHANPFHLVVNVIAFLTVAPRIEKAHGTLQTLQMAFLLPSITAIPHSLIAVIADFIMKPRTATGGYVSECTVGLSGLIFAFITIDVHERPSPRTIFGMMTIPSQITPWVLLIVAQLIFQNASFLGHLSGILAGLIFLSGYINRLRLSSSLASRVEHSAAGNVLAQRRSFIPHPGPTLPTYDPVRTGAVGLADDDAASPPWTTPGAPGGPPLPSFLGGGGGGTAGGESSEGQDAKFPGPGRTLASTSK
ncbi:hypothetical protein HDV00_010323 [Rhizophlyctis rosea]|nr:hypothetical protein HDV00_010323 [Rhizophlyctis rosea]